MKRTNAKGDRVRKTLHQRLTYANVMSTLAVFLALGGSSYAALTISGNSIENRSIPAKKLQRNSITGKEVRESRLSRVPRAKTADRLGRFTAADLMDSVPQRHFPDRRRLRGENTTIHRRRMAAQCSSALRSAHLQDLAAAYQPTAS